MRPKLLSLLVPAVLALAASARGAVILAVDFSLPGGQVEPGFQGFFVANATNGTVTSSFGANTVTVFAGTQAHNPTGVGGRDRVNPLDAGAYTYGDLYRDLVTRFESGGPGAPPLTSMTISGLTSGTVMADATGMMRIGSTFSAGSGQMNAFIISDAVPEPGMAVMAVVAAIAGLGLRRRKG